MIKKLWTRQWPFWLGGLLVGLAEIVFYYKYDMFIVVTTGFAQMYAVSEEYLFGIDWVARLYEPGIHWVIIGAVLGARLVAMAEGESRAWVRYQQREKGSGLSFFHNGSYRAALIRFREVKQGKRKDLTLFTGDFRLSGLNSCGPFCSPPHFYQPARLSTRSPSTY
uniref:Uncharacterized protein n=1 Tax=Candidatus Kentrum sp. FW TaxID=2126338 RepID=A0A450SNF7_9GAMM|nr:MAG: hypothetical protein BECKFW1821A_GA0114235_105318 [Candidatus Kentron sp. FW]